MMEKIDELTKSNPMAVLVVANGLLISSFVATVFFYKEAKEEGLSKMLSVLSVLGI